MGVDFVWVAGLYSAVCLVCYVLFVLGYGGFWVLAYAGFLVFCV